MFDFNLDSVLEEQTVPRAEAPEIPLFEEIQPQNDFSDLVFEEIPEEQEPISELAENSTEEVIPPMSDKEAAENAEILVELLDTINTVTLTPLARWKIAKKRGGKEAIRRMQAIAEKEFAGQKLEDKEKLLLARYNMYLNDKEQIEKEIPYTVDEKERLVKSATSWVKTKQIRVNGGLSFWGEFAMIQGIRVMQVLTA